MNKKGQALVEFILIMPVIIMIILSLFDYVNIVKIKMNLENKIENAILSEDESVTKTNDNGLSKYIVKERPNLISPVMIAVLGSDYEIVVERSIYE